MNNHAVHTAVYHASPRCPAGHSKWVSVVPQMATWDCFQKWVNPKDLHVIVSTITADINMVLVSVANFVVRDNMGGELQSTVMGQSIAHFSFAHTPPLCLFMDYPGEWHSHHAEFQNCTSRNPWVTSQRVHPSLYTVSIQFPVSLLQRWRTPL